LRTARSRNTKREVRDTVLGYTVFPTAWGFFGMAGDERGICRTCLPVLDRDAACRQLLDGLGQAENEPGLFVDLQSRIVAYFEGEKVEFGMDIPVVLDYLTGFACQVLQACRKVRSGRTVTYGQLAARAGRPQAARAVGSALARNPIPLIIPCHRVMCANGQLGGFSAPGGIGLKERLLHHESRAMR
jgi:methylated-DNA-[protein]-cysteine S-methyltransferase